MSKSSVSAHRKYVNSPDLSAGERVAPPARPSEAVLFYAEVCGWVMFPVPTGHQEKLRL